MIDLYLNLIPVFLFFGLGLVLRQIGVLDASKAGTLLKIVFYATLPAIFLTNLSSVQIGAEDLLLPLVPVLIVLLNLPLALWIFPRVVASKQTSASLIISALLPNNALMIPFVYWGFGETALTYVLIYDIGVALTMTSLVYALAFKLSDQAVSGRDILYRLALCPPLWALFIALSLNYSATEIPAPLMSFLEPLGNMTGPLLLIALGAMFSVKTINPRLLSMIMLLRSFVGGLLGLAVALLFGFQETALLVAVLCSSAPVAFNMVTFALQARLDVDTAASMASSSLLLALLYIPPLMALLTYLIPTPGIS